MINDTALRHKLRTVNNCNKKEQGGSLSDDYGDGNENAIKAIGLD